MRGKSIEQILAVCPTGKTCQVAGIALTSLKVNSQRKRRFAASGAEYYDISASTAVIWV
jgi:hypothetical protein